MNTWKGYLQYNGDGVSIFREVTFEVTDEEYAQIQDAIENEQLLTTCDCYKTLLDKTEAAFDLAEHLGLDYEKPDREDYDDDEEYREAMEDYEAETESTLDGYYLESTGVYDPTEELFFKRKFIGKYCDGYDEGCYDFTLYEDGDRCVTYQLTVDFDDAGHITDITDISAEGLESESVKYTNTGTAEPNYDLLEDLLKEELGIDENADYVLISKDMLDDAITEYFVKEQGVSESDLPLIMSDFQDPYDCPWIRQEYIWTVDHQGKEYEVRACKTDFSGFMTFDNEREFRFYMLIQLDDPDDTSVEGYSSAEKKYALEPIDEDDFDF